MTFDGLCARFKVTDSLNGAKNGETLRYRDHIGWNSAKIILRLISLTSLLFAVPNMTDLPPNGTPQTLAGIGVG